ncbi:MAG: phosphoenolpyruvate carboxykinase (ATP) [Armatimonadetes bacterium]|nr:phosphoenolpyruvate carboxykinase (ATP) [Armatimonadota bacterium]
MSQDQYTDQLPRRHGLEHHGFKNVGSVYWTPSTPTLYEQVVRRREGILCHLGPIAVRTGHHTGRSPDDKFVVHEPSSADHIWWGDVNRPFEQSRFDALYQRLMAYVQGRDLFIQDCYVGADPQYRMPIRVITETAWQSLFARNMFIQIRDRAKLDEHVPEFRVLAFPHFHAVPELDGTRSESFILVDFGQKTILIGGTSYAGEIKKSVFTILNYYLPAQEVLSMHCSANTGPRGDVALFFGLSGTGKTSLSADPERALIGDDEHGWSDNGIFNFEGGCYAKVIRLSPEAEPEIYQCTRRFGTILENVMVDNETRRVDLNDDTLTENTRAGYPISHLSNVVKDGLGGHPENIVLLTCDAFGVMPPIARLTTEQAMYQFLSGYTARVAGTEKGMGKEPKETFSACFGAPFMARPPTVYAEMFGQRIRKHGAKCWLINTGWQGGSAVDEEHGRRISIAHTRALVRAALSGQLDDVPTETDPYFGLAVPTSCPGVPNSILRPRDTWYDPAAYDVQAERLVSLFEKNIAKFAGTVSREVLDAGPKTKR